MQYRVKFSHQMESVTMDVRGDILLNTLLFETWLYLGRVPNRYKLYLRIQNAHKHYPKGSKADMDRVWAWCEGLNGILAVDNTRVTHLFKGTAALELTIELHTV